MSVSLRNRLKSARRRVRLVLGLYGASWIVTVVFGAALVVGLLDWRWRLDDPGLRAALALAIVAAGGGIAWRFLIAPLRRPLTDLDVAMRIEERFPEAAAGLASTVQFVGSGFDERLGSRALQERVARNTARRIEPLDLTEIVETRPVRGVALAAIGVCLVATLLVALDQSSAATAVRRLVSPFSAGPWPRQTELRLLDDRLQPLDPSAPPIRVVRGGVLEIHVENRRGRIPDDIAVEYAFQEAGAPGAAAPHRERLRRTTRRDAFGSERAVATAALSLARGPVRVRAVGGDDATGWHEVEVVPPPALEDLRITLHPPAYSRREPQQLAPGSGRIEALVGTEVSIEARANKPLATATLRLRDSEARPAQLSDDGRALSARFRVTEAGTYSYRFELEDRQGFAAPEGARYEVRGLADLFPDVSIPRPASELRVTAGAVVPMQVVAKDDLGVSELRLRHKVRDSEDGAPPAIVLYAGDAWPDRLEIQHEFDLAPLRLAPGMRVLYHAEATDDYDLGSPHVGRSLTGTLIVVSAEEKRTELAGRQAGLQDELDRAFDTQTRARQQVGELSLQLDKAGELRPADLDLLKRIEIEQRNVSARLLNPADGVQVAAQALLDEQAANGIDDPETRDRLQRIVGTLAELAREPLPAVERELTRARKLSQWSSAADPAAPPEGPKTTSARGAAPQQAAALAEASRSQDDVLESLDGLRSLLTKWRNRRELEHDLDGLIAGQRKIHEDSAEAGRRTFGREPAELSPQEQADLARLADRQARQGDELDRLAAKLGESGAKLGASDRDAGDALLDVADRIRRGAMSGRMREAAGELQRNEVGAATARQQELLAELGDLKPSLDPPAASDAETLSKRLARQEAEFEEHLRRQREIHERLETALAGPDPAARQAALERLVKEQQELREKTLDAARRLRRLEASRAEASARRAAVRMQQGEQALAGDSPAAARADLDEALDDLDQARRETAAARRAAEERLAREMMERIADDLAGMIARQQHVIDETVRLEKVRGDRGNWSRAQLKSLRDLADVQDSLRAETVRLAETVRAAEVFALVLEGAAGRMQAAAARLRERRTDAATVAHEEAARQRFRDLVATLRPEPPKSGDPASPPPTPPQEGPDADGIPQLAELKLLKLLQQDLLERTADLDALRAARGELAPQEQSEFDAIAAAQGRLADLARNLTARMARPADAVEGSEHQPSGETKPSEGPPRRPAEPAERQPRLRPVDDDPLQREDAPLQKPAGEN
ncbi:MAG: hypothetical protein WED34_02030 [Planctomycetales bacterium]